MENLSAMEMGGKAERVSEEMDLSAPHRSADIIAGIPADGYDPAFHLMADTQASIPFQDDDATYQHPAEAITRITPHGYVPANHPETGIAADIAFHDYCSVSHFVSGTTACMAFHCHGSAFHLFAQVIACVAFHKYILPVAISETIYRRKMSGMDDKFFSCAIIDQCAQEKAYL